MEYMQNATLVLKTKHELETILLGIRVPMRPVPIARVIRLIFNLTSRDSESNSLVRFGSNLRPVNA